jgi:hypothetical protein
MRRYGKQIRSVLGKPSDRLSDIHLLFKVGP